MKELIVRLRPSQANIRLAQVRIARKEASFTRLVRARIALRPHPAVSISPAHILLLKASILCPPREEWVFREVIFLLLKE